MTNLHLSLDWPNSSSVRNCHTKGTFSWEGEMTVLASGQWVLPGGSWATRGRGRRLGYGKGLSSRVHKGTLTPFTLLTFSYRATMWIKSYNFRLHTMQPNLQRLVLSVVNPKYLQDFSVGFQSVLADTHSSPPSHRTHTHTFHLLWHLLLTKGHIC